ncbi:MAG: hypothetical protein GY799_34410 [Desulfobulbaceae bacterium]|nr:hypothetical protein [Desulfobulbaceae bacterium]
MSEAAIEFLKEYGKQSLVSLGCGNFLNRLDNHVRLFVGCGLEYYVGIDRVTTIDVKPSSAFSDRNTVTELLASRFDDEPEEFFNRVKMFPNTNVEELVGIKCKVVVCQRVLPFRHWENIITRMRPELILQEDLNGCELQTISGELYKKTFPGIIHYQLKPFRPNRLRPGERNIILWRRRDFFPCRHDREPWWKQLLLRFSWS